LTTAGVMIVGTTNLPHSALVTRFNWSPDSASLAYSSECSGQRNIWVITSDGSNDVMLTDNTDPNMQCHSPFWAPDGKRIAYVFGPKTSTAVKSSIRIIEQDQTETVFELEAPLRLIGWSASGKELFVAAGENKPASFA